jgi:hypothetical protein
MLAPCRLRHTFAKSAASSSAPPLSQRRHQPRSSADQREGPNWIEDRPPLSIDARLAPPSAAETGSHLGACLHGVSDGRRAVAEFLVELDKATRLEKSLSEAAPTDRMPLPWYSKLYCHLISILSRATNKESSNNHFFDRHIDVALDAFNVTSLHCSDERLPYARSVPPRPTPVEVRSCRSFGVPPRQSFRKLQNYKSAFYFDRCQYLFRRISKIL